MGTISISFSAIERKLLISRIINEEAVFSPSGRIWTTDQLYEMSTRVLDGF